MSTHFDYGAEHSGPVCARNQRLGRYLFHGVQVEADMMRSSIAIATQSIAPTALVGQELKRLQAANTLVAITGDHGQSLYDDGTVAPGGEAG